MTQPTLPETHRHPLVAEAEAAGLDLAKVPRHVAFIMDGNGRWATRQGQQRTVGHSAGVETVRQMVRGCRALGVQVMTIYAFSTENWNRPAEEVAFLMQLLDDVIIREVAELESNGVQMRFIGHREELAPELQEKFRAAEEQTAHCDKLILNIAVNYGSRREIATAARRLAEKVQRGELAPAAVDEAALEAELFTAGLPDPDLLLRTSGEQRVSNYLLWQIAYAEIYVTEICWPDLRQPDLLAALVEYQNRQRRFGR